MIFALGFCCSNNRFEIYPKSLTCVEKKPPPPALKILILYEYFLNKIEMRNVCLCFENCLLSVAPHTLEWGTLQVCGCQWCKAEYQKNVEIGEINQIRVWNISQPNHSTLNFDYDDDDDYYHYYWWHILTEITFLDIPLVWTLPNKTKIWISFVLKIWNKVRVENLHPFIYLSIFCTRFLLHSRLRKLEHMTWLNTKPGLILALVLRSDTSGNWFASVCLTCFHIVVVAPPHHFLCQ